MNFSLVRSFEIKEGRTHGVYNFIDGFGLGGGVLVFRMEDSEKCQVMLSFV